MTSLTVKPPVPPKADRQGSLTIKVATSNLYVEDIPINKTDYISEMILEDIGGQELINLTRTNILNGQNVSYNVISNLASIDQNFNPLNIISLQNTVEAYSKTFDIPLYPYIPEVGSAKLIDGTYIGDTVYVDSDTGKVVVNTINLDPRLRIQVEFTTYSSIISQDN